MDYKDKIIKVDLEQNLSTVVNLLLSEYPSRTKIALTGDLGAGKTTFTKALCKQLGIQESITSPTFGLINEYIGQSGKVFHLDLYRLSHVDEIENVDIQTYLSHNYYVLIEWPQVIYDLLSDDFLHINIQIAENKSRIFTIRDFLL